MRHFWKDTQNITLKSYSSKDNSIAFAIVGGSFINSLKGRRDERKSRGCRGGKYVVNGLACELNPGQLDQGL